MTPIRFRTARGGKRRLSTRILANQLVILAVTGMIGFVLFAFAQRSELDRSYEQRALDIARTAAADPQIRQAMARGGDDSLVQTVAERIRRTSDASYVVVIDLHGVRHSHPMPALIGEPVEEPVVVKDGRGHTTIDHGATGRSANGKAPLYGPSGALIGEVSVGIPEHDVLGELWRELPTFGLYAALATAVGAAAAYLLARRLKRTTFGLELEEIAGLLQDREAMLHGIREGVVAFDPDGRITVVNDEARRLLGLGSALGHRLDEVLPDTRLRRALDGTLSGTDVSVLTDDHCLVVNHMPVTLHGRELGAVVTVRDRTELVGLLRELDSVRGLTDALRAQQHEFTNRMHTLAGLLDIGEHESAYEYAIETARSGQALTEAVRRHIGNPLMVGLIVAKTTVAAERGVRIELTEDSALGDDPPHLRRLLTIVGNLLDNAIDATADATVGAPPGDENGGRRIRLTVTEGDDLTLVRVADDGPGIAPGAARSIFEDGWSTRPERGTARRGLGLALVHRLVQRHGGTVTVSEGPGAVFTVVLPQPNRTGAGAGSAGTGADAGAGAAAETGRAARTEAAAETETGVRTGTAAETRTAARTGAAARTETAVRAETAAKTEAAARTAARAGTAAARAETAAETETVATTETPARTGAAAQPAVHGVPLAKALPMGGEDR
ncbi:ATP-binding protein [Streptomyces beihaiensis]|uniref:histidine kinase n=1 Tax=Streptomyces beihaiensis TaxID=2984495 RepID=A0ABT3TNT5_9ACTN|nr:sensor histidine kinase [Streptomyces beihaiensis]MCX3058667.1 sensor histidine kinase [Streptomyces beihaiensis]